MTSFVDEWKATTYREERCTNPDHEHNSPVQKMWMVKYRNHNVEVTQDGDTYLARVDGGNPGVGMDYRSMIEWVENNTR